MNIKLYSQRWGDLAIAQRYPNAPKNLIFPGATVNVVLSEREEYCYLIQEIETEFFTIRFYCFFSIEKDVVTIYNNDPAVTFRLGLDHSHQMITKELGKQVFHARSYNCFYDPSLETEYPIGPFERYIFLDITLKENYSMYLQYYFSATEELFGKASVKTAGKLAWNSHVAQTEIWRWQVELEAWCHETDKTNIQGNKIAHRLIKQSIQSINSHQEKRGIALTNHDVNKIYDAAEMIENSDEVYSLQILAAKVGLSIHKLNIGFKEIYGHNVSRHKFEEKMLSALRLMDCKDSSNEKVALLLGYNDTRKFKADFTKRFGREPIGNSESTQ